MEIGIHSFAAIQSDPASGIDISPADRLVDFSKKRRSRTALVSTCSP